MNKMRHCQATAVPFLLLTILNNCLKLSHCLDETLKIAMEVNLHNLRSSMEKHTLSALAWMVADGILDFKPALARNKLEQGEFHDK